MANNSSTVRERKKTLMLIDEYIKSEESEKVKSPIVATDVEESQHASAHSAELDPFLGGTLANVSQNKGGEDYSNMLHDFSTRLYSWRWPSHMQSIIAQLTHTIGHSNLIYFPNLCARHGGGAFLIPYLICYVCVGIPLLYAEMILGQFSSLSPMEIFRRMSPPLAGIAVAMFAVVVYRSLYFSAVISQLLYAGALTIKGIWSDSLPGSNCDDPEYNSAYCHPHGVEQTCNVSYLSPDSHRMCENYWIGLQHPNRVWVPPHTDYIIGTVFQPKFKFNDLHFPSTSVVCILMAVWLFSAFCAMKGTRSVAGVFSILKAVCIGIVIVNMVISILSQDETDGGLSYFLSPDLSHLRDLETWSSAISHVLFSLNLGDGTVHRLASYNNFNENFIFNAIIIAICDVAVSLMAGVTFFSAVGTISASLYAQPNVLSTQRISRTLFNGFTLTFTAFPDQVLLTGAPTTWVSLTSSAHYFNLAKSGFSNLVMYIELILICVTDALSRFVNWENDAKHLKRFFAVAVVAIFGFAMSVVYAGPSGIYLTKLVDEFSGVALMIICLVEIIAVVYAYGLRRFLANVETMIIGGDREWKLSMTSLGLFYYVITPFFLVAGIVLKAIYNHQAVILDFLFPETFEFYGWTIVIFCTMMIPFTMLYYATHLPINFATLRAYMEPTTLWGPARPADREKNIRNERVVRKL